MMRHNVSPVIVDGMVLTLSSIQREGLSLGISWHQPSIMEKFMMSS